MRAEQLATSVTVFIIQLLLTLKGLIFTWSAIPLLEAIYASNFPGRRHLPYFLRSRDFFLLALVVQVITYGV